MTGLRDRPAGRDDRLDRPCRSRGLAVTGTFRVLIVEDDVVIARVYATLVGSMPHFTVAGTARTASGGIGEPPEVRTAPRAARFRPARWGQRGRSAASAALGRPSCRGHCDHCPTVDRSGPGVDAARSARLPGEAVLGRASASGPEQFGIAARNRATALAQEEVDQLRKASAPAEEWVPRELSAERLVLVRRALAQQTDPLSAEQLAGHIGSSRVTARRYLEFLVALQEVDVLADGTSRDVPGNCTSLAHARGAGELSGQGGRCTSAVARLRSFGNTNSSMAIVSPA